MENETQKKIEGKSTILINEYKCKRCLHSFCQTAWEVPYCPACDCEDLIMIFEDIPMLVDDFIFQQLNWRTKQNG